MAEPDQPLADAPAPAARSGRWKTWALVASLGLNLFVAAAAIGAGLRHHGEPRDIGFGPFTEALSHEDRAAMRDAFLAAAPDFRDRRREAAMDAAGLATALRAEPFDPGAVEALLSRQQDRAEQRFALGRRLFVERLGQMTPAARAELAGRIEEMMERRRKPD